ncbi:major facilitator superfamily domain-containing protein [Aspergillus pseudoustus]|uniref:Major facilitator superfamily domain-containing protein n=1 Tax=Aspergillus pseudoustus TaxID=1810923 RepID=A0ABR4JSU1_9EURO
METIEPVEASRRTPFASSTLTNTADGPPKERADSELNRSRPVITSAGDAQFCPGDPEDPKAWSFPRKCYCTGAAIFLVVNATFASSSPVGCLQGIADEFDVSTSIAGLVITVFLIGYCAGPLFFAPLSEFYGRRIIFLITFTGYFVFNFLCAFAPNLGALLTGRLLCGIFASAPLTNAPGLMSDIWNPIQRGNAMAVFAMMIVIGPALGPVISGFLQLTKDWRWSFYVLLFLGALTECMVFTIPETLPSRILVNKLRKLKNEGAIRDIELEYLARMDEKSLLSSFKETLYRPWVIMLDPIASLVAVYTSLVYMLQYMLFEIYPLVFREQRGWNAGVSQLPLIGTAIGGWLGGLIIFYFSAREKARLQSGARLTPEDRLPAAMIGGIGFCATMFWFSWSAASLGTHWMVPTLAGTFLSTSMGLIFVSNLNYLSDTYPLYTASAIAGNTVCRSACGAVAPLFTRSMFVALGVGGGGSVVAGAGAVLACAPFIFYRYGTYIRGKSKFASTQVKPS